MTALPRYYKKMRLLSGLLALSSMPVFATGIAATATYTATADANLPGLYDYALTLNNTGTTTIGTFWFAWIPGGDFLAPKPVSFSVPPGWTASLISNATNTGTSIRWVNTANPLAAGQSLAGFNFVSAETPDQLLGNVPSGTGAGLPVLTSFAYIGPAFADPGLQFVATAATPEPSSILLLTTGLLGGVGGVYRRLRSPIAA